MGVAQGRMSEPSKGEKGETGDCYIQGTDPISKYSEVMGPRCLSVGEGRYTERKAE